MRSPPLFNTGAGAAALPMNGYTLSLLKNFESREKFVDFSSARFFGIAPGARRDCCDFEVPCNGTR